MAEEKVVSALRGQMAALAEKNGYPSSVALAMVDDDVVLYEVETGEGMRLMTPEEIGELERINKVKPVQGRQISAADKLLTLTAGEMERYGISSATVNDMDNLFEVLKIDEESVFTIEKETTDWMVAFLSSAAVTSVLIMLAMVALYMEVSTPGFGVPGTMALICFSVVFATSMLMGNLSSLELLLFLTGIIFLLVEIFLIPGFGITGVTGIILILFSLVFSRQSFVIPEFTWQWDLFKRNLLSVSLSLFGGVILIGILMRTLPQSKLFIRLILKNSPNKSNEESHIVPEQPVVNPKGEKGVACTDLRPVGKADFKGEVIIVQTDGEYIESGSEVTVIRKEGLRLVVKRS